MLIADTKVVKRLLQNKRYEMKGLVMEYKQRVGRVSHLLSPSEALEVWDTRRHERNTLCIALMTRVVEGYGNGNQVWSPMVQGCTTDLA